MATLKNIIFDLGGVLLSIDYKKTANAFVNLGVEDFEKMYDQFSADDLFIKLETGHISQEYFFKQMQARIHSLTPESITAAWNAMVLNFRLESLQFLEVLSKKYNLYLLSNTNVIHKENFDRLFTQETGRRSLDDYFIKAYYSHLIGFRKPNADIFTFVLKDADLNAGETLFIDDSSNNTEAAQELGIKTHLLLPDEKIENLKLSI